jgi:MoxR-like ATPase
MEERQITVDGVTHWLPSPFMVMATQNPIEYEGTFPLPEAQLDRFLLRIRLGYPDPADEMIILDRQQVAHPLDSLQQVVPVDELLEAQQAVRRDIYVDRLIRQYIVAVVGATRQHQDVYLGASPRGSLGLYRSSQALAALRGRDYVIPDDVKALAESVLAHRLIVSPAARIKNVSASEIIAEVLDTVPIPGARGRTG